MTLKPNECNPFIVDALFGINAIPTRGTSIKDVQQFLMIFDPPTYHVRQFLTYNVQFFGVILAPPTYPKSDVINGRSLGLILIAMMKEDHMTIKSLLSASFEQR